MTKPSLIKEWDQHAGSMILDESDARAAVYDLKMAMGQLHDTAFYRGPAGFDKSAHLENDDLDIELIRGFDIPYHGAGELAVITEKSTGFRIILEGEAIKRSFDNGVKAYDLSETEQVADIERITQKVQTLCNEPNLADSVTLIDQDTISIAMEGQNETLSAFCYPLHGEVQQIKAHTFRAVVPTPQP